MPQLKSHALERMRIVEDGKSRKEEKGGNETGMRDGLTFYVCLEYNWHRQLYTVVLPQQTPKNKVM